MAGFQTFLTGRVWTFGDTAGSGPGSGGRRGASSTRARRGSRSVLEKDARSEEETEEPLHEGEVALLSGEGVGVPPGALRFREEPRVGDDVLFADQAKVSDPLFP